MKRKIYDKLVNWKNERNGKTALLIEGARRVGKSYIALEFAKENYETYLLIDFNFVTDEVKNIFNNYLEDLDTFFIYLSNYYKVNFIERKTLIVFDEVQLFPRARSAIKALVADGRYDYIETGSLISIRENVKDILIPSEEEHLPMYPMDFEEFLWATGNDNLFDLIKQCYNDRKPLGVLHRKVMDLFKKYLLVGGMPQAVEEFILTNSFEKVDIIKRNILTLYRDDIKKHSSSYNLKIESIYDDIPSQLEKHDKKFKITALDKDAKFRDYSEAFLWLDDAKIVNTCYNSTEPSIGLGMNRENSSYKCYMGDTGLLISLAFSEKDIMSEEIYKKILFDSLEFNYGMIIENVVAQMLLASSHKLFFYSNYSKEKDDRMEIDFLIQTKVITSRHNISALEVKSGKNYTISSLNKVKTKYSSYIDKCYVIHKGDYLEKDGIIYLPFYMVPLL